MKQQKPSNSIRVNCPCALQERQLRKGGTEPHYLNLDKV